MGAPWNVLEVDEIHGVGSSEGRVTSENYVMRLGVQWNVRKLRERDRDRVGRSGARVGSSEGRVA
jgi:hypothetical protein